MTEKDFYQIIAGELGIRSIQVVHTIELLDDGNTVPFISRYRKEATGKLDEEQIRAVEERIKYLRLLQERKETILKSIEEQEKLTPELAARIRKTMKLQELEDLYLPYRPKRRTRGMIARERGLEPLAELMLKQEMNRGDLFQIATAYVDPAQGLPDVEAVLAGARDIVAEVISEDADIRKVIRENTRRTGLLNSKIKSGVDSSDFQMYHDFSEPLRRIVPHRVLAINRGEREKVLSVSVSVDTEEMDQAIARRYIRNRNSIFTAQLEAAVADGYKRLIAPSIERELRAEQTEKADAHAIEVFATNLGNLLLQPPVKGKIIMGIDPGFRSGCKVAVIDETGRYVEGCTIFPHPPQKQSIPGKSMLRDLIERHAVQIIAIGNGTASRETEALVAELIGEIKKTGDTRLPVYIIVNEAGASVYSASKVAREEFPELDASMRGNISIARRLLDPLAELVKIDPKHIGVGLYQHDVNQRNLGEALEKVVESAVNRVGVDLNTASASLLKHISGLTSRTATSIISYRDENGKFHSRKELKKVSGVGDIAFQQSAGFLRIPDAENPLDNTSIHPESYSATRKLLSKFKVGKNMEAWRELKNQVRSEYRSLSELAGEIGIGEPTLEDILGDLEKPGRDPRDEMPGPIFKSDVLNIEDLREGMMLQGTVRNVVDFGAFVDIGVKRDGLVHVSEMADRFIKNPLEIVAVGDVVTVRVIDVDVDRGRVQLSMKGNS